MPLLLESIDEYTLLGIDFSSSPTKAKPVAVAQGQWVEGVLKVGELHSFTHLEGFETLLQHGPTVAGEAGPAPYLAVIDMPFGLSRELVDKLNWPGAQRTDKRAWGDLIDFYASLGRDDIRSIFKAWCDARPAGQKFAHRACDKPAGSSPSMKWVNPPVAYMLHAGAPLLKKAGVFIPGMQAGDPQRIALEGYPGYWARQVLGRQSYKSDDPKKDTPDRRMARSELLCALEEGMLLGIRVQVRPYLRARLLEDAKADHLDAVLCCLVAAWCAKRADQQFGLPQRIDPVEGWIAGIPATRPV
ncbi:DUF429 domain-containing protein [Limnobacter humi]|uniref:DUF429 domain-containing protein n=1 Tax=Limnobacter humi TaxID=1778671 RepID=A0ABT1WE01_9BURK|nr:DUF429 domain-containing protein [Limnobacter humi]MCQ8895266.1 DUF429 domain-containing protein [Limnobacter humi]